MDIKRTGDTLTWTRKGLEYQAAVGEAVKVHTKGDFMTGAILEIHDDAVTISGGHMGIHTTFACITDIMLI